MSKPELIFSFLQRRCVSDYHSAGNSEIKHQPGSKCLTFPLSFHFKKSTFSSRLKQIWSKSWHGSRGIACKTNVGVQSLSDGRGATPATWSSSSPPAPTHVSHHSPHPTTKFPAAGEVTEGWTYIWWSLSCLPPSLFLLH